MLAATIDLTEFATASSWSNCFNVFAASGVGLPDSAVAPRMVNALELSWNMPYAIPSDKTQCSLTCKTNDAKLVNDWSMYASSIVTNVGVGNCYYTNTIGVDTVSD